MPRDPTRPVVRLLGWSLLALLAVAWVGLGAVRPGTQAVLHFGVAALALLARRAPDDRLATAGVLVRGARASALLLVVLALPLLPVPRGLAALVAPGRLAARPDDAWLTLGAEPARIPGEIASVVLPLGFAIVVAAWAVSGARQGKVERAVTGATAVAAVLALAHAGAGADSVLGIVTPLTVPTPFFAPFVDGNHAASVMLLGGAVAVGTALQERQERWIRRAAAATALLAAVVLGWVFSSGALLAGAMAGVAWILRGRNLLRGPVVAVGFVLVGLVQLRAGSVAWQEGSAMVRARLWRDALHLGADHWLVGAGGGSFGEALRAYRSDTEFLAIAHAHSDPLEWVVETGVIGLLALGAFVLALRPLRWTTPRRADPFVIGLLAVALHSFVDFPLQIPAIALACAGVAGCLAGALAEGSPTTPAAARGALLAVALVQVPAGLWQARAAAVEDALRDLPSLAEDPDRPDADAEQRLRLLHAGAADLALLAGRRAIATKDTETALRIARALRHDHPDAPDILVDAGFLLARAGQLDDATEALERAGARAPSDYRPWIGLARVARAKKDIQLSADRWVEAFRRGASGFDEAYATFPLGLYWLDALADVDARHSLVLARKLVREGDDEVAIMAFEQAARLDPARYGAILERAPVLVKVGRPDEAERWVRGVLERDPADPKAQAQLANALEALGRHEEAAEAWLRASAKLPATRVRALRSEEAARGPDAALTLARRFELEGRADAEVRLEVARLHRDAGDPASCVQDVERGKLLTDGGVRARAEALLATCRARADR